MRPEGRNALLSLYCVFCLLSLEFACPALSAFVSPFLDANRFGGGGKSRCGRRDPRIFAANQVLARLRMKTLAPHPVGPESNKNSGGSNSIVRAHGAVSAAAPFTSGSKLINQRAEDAKLSEENVTCSLGKQLVKAGKFNEARLLYEEALTRNSGNGRLWMQLFKLHKSQGSLEDARFSVREGLRHNPCNALLWQAWADLEKDVGRFQAARQLFKKGIEANPRLPSLYNSWGRMERDLGDIQTARQILQDGLQQAPSSVRLLISLGILEDVEGNNQDARNLLLRGIQSEPSNPFAHQALAMLEYKLGNVADAREYLRRAVACDQDHTMSWLSWARLEENLGNIDNARRVYAEGCKSNGGRGTANLWQSWARMEEQQSNNRAAIEIYKKAISAFSSDAQLFVEYSKLLERRGEIESARKMLKEALRADSSDVYVYQCLGRLEAHQLNYDQARVVFSAGIAAAEAKLQTMFNCSRTTENGKSKDDRAMADLLHTWATFEEKVGNNFNLSRSLFHRAISCCSTEGWLWRSFAEFERRQGNSLVARHCFAMAVNNDPRDGLNWIAWSQLEESMGESTRASFYSKRGAELQARQQIRQALGDSRKPLTRLWNGR
mmetsp:Transcript_511/g.1145  ORF Transcript_511/g.1145 Transcript_511/m.1145 type:complete len:609 (-) Transcript_511:176-2002(-)